MLSNDTLRIHKDNIQHRNKSVVLGFLSGVFFLAAFGLFDISFGTDLYTQVADTLYGIKGFYFSVGIFLILGSISAVISFLSGIAEFFYQIALGILSFALGSGFAIYGWAFIAKEIIPEGFGSILVVVAISVVAMWFLFTRAAYDAVMKPKGKRQTAVFVVYFLIAGFYVIYKGYKL